MVAKNKDVTYVYFLLDQTGSMGSYLSQTISGFNEYINSLKKQKGFRLSLTLFNSAETELRYKELDISKVEELNDKTYIPDNTTPLYDALGKAITEAEKSRDKKDKVLFVVFTDGLENASKEYDFKKISEMISEKRKDGWEFVYLGANQDAWDVGGRIGISLDNISSFNQDKTGKTFQVAYTASVNYSRGSTSKLISEEDSLTINS